MSDLHKLIQNAQQGDQRSVVQLINLYSATIDLECKKFSMWQHPDWSHADLEQEVMLQVWIKIHKFRNEESAELEKVFKSWLVTTTRNVLINLLRHQSAKKRKADKPVEQFDETTLARMPSVRSPSSIVGNNEAMENMEEAMRDNIDEVSQQILFLRIGEGLTIDEIAAKLSLTKHQVRYRFDKSLSALYEILN